MAVSESALCPPKYSFSTFRICFFSFSRSFLVRSSYFFWLRSASFCAFSFLDSTFFLHRTLQYNINDFSTGIRGLRFALPSTPPVLHYLSPGGFVQELKHVRFTVYGRQLHRSEKIQIQRPQIDVETD